MNLSPNRLRWLAAAGILAGGAAWSAVLVLAPPREVGIDTTALQALAHRLRQPPRTEIPARRRTASTDAPVITASASPRKSRAEHPKRALVIPPPRTALLSPRIIETRLRSAPAPAPAADPLKNIALAGVTQEGTGARAWLARLDAPDRQEAAVGELVYGFTVKEIRDDSVLLGRDGRDYLLRLGEKPIPAGPVQTAALETPTADRGGLENVGPFGGQPGIGPPSGRFGFGFTRGSGTGGFGRQGSLTLGGGARSTPVTRSNVTRRTRRTATSGTGNSGGGGAAGGGAPAGGAGGGFAGNRFAGGVSNTTNASGTSVFASNSTSTTSNPQTARRLGIRLQGNLQEPKTPEALVNPQTERRTGETSSTRATTSPSSAATGAATQTQR